MIEKYNKPFFLGILALALQIASASVSARAASIATNTQSQQCGVELVTLGVGQDGGAPHIGRLDDPAWANIDLTLWPTSLALIDHRADKRYLFETTPEITRQLHLLHQLAPTQRSGLAIDGVFLTHAHIGHYTGLMFFGREAAGARSIPVHVMPRFANYLRTNGPWEQLVRLQNVSLVEMASRRPERLAPDITVTPLRVPHRDEYSETVGFLIETDGADALFIPDIDSWDAWKRNDDVAIEELVSKVDYAFLDATFYDDNELPGRDMSEIPHPRVVDMMERFADLPDAVRHGIKFIHFNHTNPIRYRQSEETRNVLARGYGIARAGERFCLID
ncbi:MAG: pyrroloquinoline quinone biosynthesis protein PqqB [Hyphomonadaceae bacterium]|nr:pyrroloquinoline quinone biosynthesis protein PqqB [Hyphomonadaceae bacterium]OUX93671.1 MAG: hypothetical protein CBB77_08340 [Hyphomonas sp. TMED17]